MIIVKHNGNSGIEVISHKDDHLAVKGSSIHEFGRVHGWVASTVDAFGFGSKSEDQDDRNASAEVGQSKTRSDSISGCSIAHHCEDMVEDRLHPMIIVGDKIRE